MTNANTQKRVLYIGQLPETVDFSDPALPPGTDAAKIHKGIQAAMQQMADSGLDADLCLISPDDTAVTDLEHQFSRITYDCVVIGGGLRVPPKSLVLFETVINTVHRLAPYAAIAFNTTPEDTAAAAQRWVSNRKRAQ